MEKILDGILKKGMSVLLAVALVAATFAIAPLADGDVEAYAAEDQGFTYEIIVGIGVNVTDYNGTSVVVPKQLGGQDVVSINLSEKALTSLDVTACTSLMSLYCESNQLSTLDVSKNVSLGALHCYNNQLSALDVSKNTELVELHCFYNQLSELDVSSNSALKFLYCRNNQLSTLNVNNNTALEYLDCWGNQLSTLDVSKNPALEYLMCGGNQLSTLDVSNNTALEELNCWANQLSTLDVSKNLVLERLFCGDNQLSTLDTSKNVGLEYLECASNRLSALDLSKNTVLESLYCGFNPLSTLDLNNNTALYQLHCEFNQLITLDVSNNTALAALSCFSNQLSMLDVSQNTALDVLFCDSNQLKTLDVSKNPALIVLDCSSNQLSTLDVSKNTALDVLYCDSNQLSTLDVSKNLSLNLLHCMNNRISDSALLDYLIDRFGTDNVLPQDAPTEQITYTVIFKDWDGTTLKTQTVAYGATAAAPTPPTRLGYDFTGWNTDFSNVTSDLIVTAQYSQSNMIVIDEPGDYSFGGGEMTGDLYINCNDVHIDNLVLHGNLYAKGTNIDIWGLSVDGDMDIYSQWSSLSYVTVKGQTRVNEQVANGNAYFNYGSYSYIGVYGGGSDSVHLKGVSVGHVEINKALTGPADQPVRIVFEDGAEATSVTVNSSGSKIEIPAGVSIEELIIAATAANTSLSGGGAIKNLVIDNSVVGSLVNSGVNVEKTSVVNTPKTTFTPQPTPYVAAATNIVKSAAKKPAAPKKLAAPKAKVGKKQIKVTWKKSTTKGISGYEVQYRIVGKKWATKKLGAKATSLTIKKLKPGKRYEVRVRALTKSGGKTAYGAWSKTMKSGKVKR
jgi:uncharacterized repeat protein (TIGR02543 family)